MNDDFDVAKMDLPEYCEETSALPDVESESSFAEQKEEIYRRNIALAADENQTGMYRELYPANADAEEIYPQVQQTQTAAADSSFAAKIANPDNRKKILGILSCAAIVVIVAVVAFICGRNEHALDLNAAAVSKADEKAKNMHTAASACIAELYVEGIEIEGHKFENSGTVFIVGDTEKNMAEVLGNSFSGYVYGVFEEETYFVEYALWSAEPIPDEYKRKLTDSEQELLAKSGIIIGCYPSAED